MLYNGVFPHGHFLSTTLTIPSVLQYLQQIPFFSPGTLKFGRFPHKQYFLLMMSIMSSVLQILQHIGFVSPGTLKLDCFPHGHFRGI
jgi:hypothetical protein